MLRQKRQQICETLSHQGFAAGYPDLLKVQGTVPDVSVQPDLVSIGSKVLQEKAAQALDQGMNKLSEMLGGKKVRSPLGGEPSGQLSQRDQLIQQGMALFAKFQESQPSRSSDAGAASAEGATEPQEDREALVQEGMALLSKYRETQKQ